MRKLVLFLLIIITIGGFAAAGYAVHQITETNTEYNEAKSEYEVLVYDHAKPPMQPENPPKTNRRSVQQTVEDESGEVIIEEKPIPTTINLPLETIDFNGLANINNDIIGWIYADKAQVNYPVTQSKKENPDKYLYYTFEGQRNGSGCPFVYPETSADLTDPVTLIYGHNMANGTMFGSIANIYGSESAVGEKIFLYKRNGEVNIYKVIAGITTHYTSSIFSTPNISTGYTDYIRQVIAQADYIDQSYVPNQKDRVIALSTCKGRAGTDTRFVLYALYEETIK